MAEIVLHEVGRVSMRLGQDLEQTVDLLVSTDADAEASRVAGIAHQAYEYPPFLEQVEGLPGGSSVLAHTKLDWLSGTV